jgi:hypothetical protein
MKGERVMFLSPCTSAPGDQDVEREGRNLLVPEQIFISPVSSRRFL